MLYCVLNPRNSKLYGVRLDEWVIILDSHKHNVLFSTDGFYYSHRSLFFTSSLIAETIFFISSFILIL